MKRLTLLTIVCAFLLGALTSCNILDKKYVYAFGYEAEVGIADEEDSKAVQEYLKTNFIEKEYPTYYDDNHGALVHFLDYYVKHREEFDQEFIYSHLKKSTDYVLVIANMTSSANKVMVGYQIWRGAGEEGETPAAQ